MLDIYPLNMIFYSIRMKEKKSRAFFLLDSREGLVLLLGVGEHSFGVRLTDVSHIGDFKVEEMAGEKKSFYVTGKDAQGIEVPGILLNRLLGIESSSEDKIFVIFESENDKFGIVVDEVKNILPGGQVPEVAYPKLLGKEGERLYGGFFNWNGRLVPALNPSYLKGFVFGFEGD